MSMIHQIVRELLRVHGIRLNTDLGQHFLVDDDVLAAIADAAEVKQGATVLEIGPGMGILTRVLLEHGAHVTAVEIDPRMPMLLRAYVGRERATTNDRLTIIEGNALHVALPISAPYTVVANIPYHITSPLLHRLLLELPLPTSLTLLVQREVAEAIAADGSKSILAVLVRLFGTATLIRTVPPAAFLPPPAVDSAILHVQCFTEPLVSADRARTILRVVKHAMSQRRKMLRGSMKSLPGGIEALAHAQIDPSSRPEALTTAEWIRLTDALRPPDA